MGNNPSGETNEGEPSCLRHCMEDGIIAASLQRKIRMMGALSHDCRARVEERSHLRERLAEMKAERRRISVDLRGEGGVACEEPVDFIRAVTHSTVTRDTSKPALAAYESDKICGHCGKEAPRQKNFPCRVCTRIFHPDCLKECGECRPADLKAADRALTNQGWSCFHCSNLSLLLAEEEIEELIQAFDEFDKNKDNQVTWEEYRDARALNTSEPLMRGQGRRMSAVTEMVVKLEFQMADQDEDQVLDWWEFLNLASQHQLGKRPEAELVGLLTEKEVIKAKAVFNELDKDRDGVVSGLEARRAVRQWVSPFNNALSPDAMAKMSPTIDSHVEVRAKMLVGGGDEQRDVITWPDFLAEQALYILCSRPNMAPHLLDTLHSHHFSEPNPGRPPLKTKRSGLQLHHNHNHHHQQQHSQQQHSTAQPKTTGSGILGNQHNHGSTATHASHRASDVIENHHHHHQGDAAHSKRATEGNHH